MSPDLPGYVSDGMSEPESFSSKIEITNDNNIVNYNNDNIYIYKLILYIYINYNTILFQQFVVQGLLPFFLPVAFFRSPSRLAIRHSVAAAAATVPAPALNGDPQRAGQRLPLSVADDATDLREKLGAGSHLL